MADGQQSRRNSSLVEESQDPAWRRHVHHGTGSKRKEDTALHPVHRSPDAVFIPARCPHLTGFQSVQHAEHHVLGIGRQRFPGRSRGEFLDACSQGRGIHMTGSVLEVRCHQIPSTPAATSDACTADMFDSLKGTRGRRSTFSIMPSIDSAAFAGIGLGSMNAAAIHGCSRRCRFRAVTRSFAAQASHSCAIRRGVALLVTEMTPSPPSAITGSVIESSPERTENPCGRSRMMSAIWLMLPDASFTATTLVHFASSSVVRASMLLPVRPGTL